MEQKTKENLRFFGFKRMPTREVMKTQYLAFVKLYHPDTTILSPNVAKERLSETQNRYDEIMRVLNAKKKHFWSEKETTPKSKSQPIKQQSSTFSTQSQAVNAEIVLQGQFKAKKMPKKKVKVIQKKHYSLSELVKTYWLSLLLISISVLLFVMVIVF